MAITESRVRKGVLTFGADTDSVDFSCQPSNVRVTPSYDDDGDRLETLCGDVIPPGKIESWVLAGTSVQDFDDPDGFMSYCFDNRMMTVPFSWQPNIEGAPTWSGSVVLVALEEGGDVNTRLTADFEFDISGDIVREYGGSSGGTPATGATAGTPGTWTPSGSTPPADAASAGSVTANPTTAWTTGQYVQGSTSGSAGEMHWDGSTWTGGKAP
jgi:hypothetical protein